MKAELIRYRCLEVDFLAVIKNELVIDIACSNKGSTLGEPFAVRHARHMRSGGHIPSPCRIHGHLLGEILVDEATEIQARDLALYTHWPVHTKEFWDLYFESCLNSD